MSDSPKPLVKGSENSNVDSAVDAKRNYISNEAFDSQKAEYLDRQKDKNAEGSVCHPAKSFRHEGQGAVAREATPEEIEKAIKEGKIHEGIAVPMGKPAFGDHAVMGRPATEQEVARARVNGKVLQGEPLQPNERKKGSTGEDEINRALKEDPYTKK